MTSPRMILYIFYYEDDNIFCYDDGCVIYNLFSIITPQDLFLFRNDPGYNSFWMRNNPDVLVEIISIPSDEVIPYDIPQINIGDDFERIERYNNSKHHV